ncbi:choice-of-anchor A family protein [Undibacterium sp. TS12]|uniref:choice-of-anchor A family protein n=1 Tax=Undibacterium sp. TS12 TaxID=2908202 RepID=UPI001F4C8D79|nr:choice-of-anchor A family protein [Undibacterium sp. TS12]MCH8619960.1 choice-of-anchor A family protein [Undibacterium sp. TS12]
MTLHLQQPFNFSLRLLARNAVLLCLSAGLILSPALAGAQQIDLGVAGQYAAFVFGNVSNITNVDGRMAVGGILNTPGGTVGGSVNYNDTNPVMVVAGNLTSYGGSLGNNKNNAYAVYAGTLGSKAATYLDFRKVAISPIDFEAERAYLSVLSQQIRTTPATGTVSQTYARVTLTGSNRDIEIFNLTADHVISTHDFDLVNVKPSAYIILNVASDAQRTLKFGITMTEFINRHSKVLFNMYDAELINFNNAGVFGSILAPFACIKNSGGKIEGTVIAASWDTNMAVGSTLFVPTN